MGQSDRTEVLAPVVKSALKAFGVQESRVPRGSPPFGDRPIGLFSPPTKVLFVPACEGNVGVMAWFLPSGCRLVEVQLRVEIHGRKVCEFGLAAEGTSGVKWTSPLFLYM